MEAIKAFFKFRAKDSKGKDAPVQAHDLTEGKSAAKLEIEELASRAGKSTCCRPCFKLLFVVLSVFTAILAVADMVVTVTTAIATRLYGSEQSGRLVAMIILAVLAAVTISILIYAKIAVFKKQTKPLHAAAIVLILVAVIQALVIGVAVRVSDHDEQALSKDLRQSFRLSRENNPRHAALWAATQHELTCCGVQSPEDYRTPNLPVFFAPNVPISCCPDYDPDRSELVQERKREVCKARKTFYPNGCRDLVVEGFITSAHIVIGITSSLIVLEVILAITASILYKKMKKQKSRRSDEDQSPKP